MSSTLGRPRTVTDAQAKIIMAWYEGPRSVPQLARQMNLPVTTVEYCISIRGCYKQPSPELRQQNLKQRKAQVRSLEREGWL
ncbi:MAG TPA: hypothetical protein PKE27_08915 [Povalibacter sp.]|uniref:hypothetical protein n=1 Tax=Povalibacter sp. TaxID=1962978 RepID=UPI002C713C81|nr:hypothetical protein [Povalibacter sp.]HMN44680.1 hypothetical protein [Povalibacter sp.]